MKFFKIPIIILLGAFVLTSCSEMTDFFRKDSITIGPMSASVNAAPQELLFDLNASEEWTAEVSGKWLTISPSSGGRDTKQITVSATANLETVVRTDTITFVCGKITVKVPVSQEGLESIISTTDIVLDETASFTMEAYSSWRIDLTDTKALPLWLRVSPTSGEKGHAEISVESIQDNVWEQDRNAFIKIAMDGKYFYLTVTQKHVNAVLESKDKVEVPFTGGVFSLDVKANMECDIEYPREVKWISEAPAPTTKAPTTSTFYFKVDPNEDYDSRETYLVVVGEVTSDTVRIFQAQKDELILNQDSIRVNFTGTSHPVELRTNIEYSTTIVQEGEWVRIVTPQALRTDQVSLRIDENATSSKRKAQIIFKDINSSLSDTLYITQGSTSDYPFLGMTDCGVYSEFGEGDSIVYSKYIDQLSLSQGNFRVQNYNDKHFLHFKGIPANLSQGDTFDLEVIQNYNEKISSYTSLPVDVIKISDSLVWLYNIDSELGFIIIK